MSVINNALKELENRSSQFSPIEIASVRGGDRAKSPIAESHVMMILILLLGIALLTAFYQPWRYFPAGGLHPVAEINTPKPNLAASPTLTELSVSGNRIIGLQISESSTELNLEFLLQDKVVGYLKERSEDSFIYHLKDMQSEIAAPVIEDNRWLEQLSIASYDDGIDIHFRTKTRVLVETQQKMVANEQIWNIKLKKMARYDIVRAKIAASEVTAQLAKSVPDKVESIRTAPVKKQAVSKQVAVIEPKPVKLNITSSNGKGHQSDQLHQIEQLIRNRQWSLAETGLLSMISGPDDFKVRKLLLNVYRQQRNAQQFSSLVQESIKLYPRYSMFRTEYAKSLYQMNAYQAVIDLVRLSPDRDASQNALIAASLQRLEQHQEAVKYYKESLAIDERQSRNWVGLGISQEHTGDLVSALASYATALKLGKLNQKLHAFVGNRSQLIEKALN